MGRKRQSQPLYVYMNGKRVGTLVREGHLIFTYDVDWLNWEDSRPISLSMPLSEIPYKGAIPENFFDNLLPDSGIIRKRIQARFNLPSNHCFDLLTQIGGDCVGALQLLTQDKAINVKKVESEHLSNHAIAKLLKNYHNAPLGMARENDFRISIAGAQEKTALLRYKKKWYLPLGFTPTSHIIKLPIGRIQHSSIDLSDSIENEWLCLKILSAYDLPVNQANIEYFEDVKTLVVERFDRIWAKDYQWLVRLPQEDFCQALGIASALKYESDGGPGISAIMNLLQGSKNPIEDREKFMKVVFLFWVIGAIDGHAKNFSVALQAQGRFHLTPFYDVISAYPLAAKRQIEWQELKMAMSVKNKNRHYLWKMIQARHWLAMADYCQFPKQNMKNIIEEIFDNMEIVISNVSNTIVKDFPSQISDSIFAGMREVKNRNHVVKF